jgi:hypothetical protein
VNLFPQTISPAGARYRDFMVSYLGELAES